MNVQWGLAGFLCVAAVVFTIINYGAAVEDEERLVSIESELEIQRMQLQVLEVEISSAIGAVRSFEGMDTILKFEKDTIYLDMRRLEKIVQAHINQEE